MNSSNVVSKPRDKARIKDLMRGQETTPDKNSSEYRNHDDLATTIDLKCSMEPIDIKGAPCISPKRYIVYNNLRAYPRKDMDTNKKEDSKTQRIFKSKQSSFKSNQSTSKSNQSSFTKNPIYNFLIEDKEDITVLPGILITLRLPGRSFFCLILSAYICIITIIILHVR